MDQLGKIRRHHWKEHLKVKFEGICLNPLSPKSDQHQISPRDDINAL